jgi:heat shock protein HtpX
MWEAIASNQRRSWLLIGIMGGVLVLLGALIGWSVAEQFAGGWSTARHFAGHWSPRHDAGVFGGSALSGVLIGTAVALLVWLILWVTATASGDRILLASTGAHEIQKEQAPQLWNVVEEMSIAAGLGSMPRVFIMDDPSLNAFAVGRLPEKAAVVVTAGLLKRLNRDELQGVIGHEIGHIRNMDARFMTLAAVMLGAIALISRGFLRGLFYGGGRRRSSSRGGGQAQLIILLVAVLVALLAPVAAQLLYLACSRRREFLADASSARFTRYPEGLASALEKISAQLGTKADKNRVVAPLCIVNPLQEHAPFTLFSTHPDTRRRILILRRMANAGYAAYEEAYRRTHGKGACIDAATLAEDEAAPLRAPTPEPAPRAAAVERAKAAGDLLSMVLPLAIIHCTCGANLKVPANFKRDQVACPRCGRQHATPRAQPSKSAQGAAAPMIYVRQGLGWESFHCSCGHLIQLSPEFAATTTACSKCHRRIAVITAGAPVS